MTLRERAREALKEMIGRRARLYDRDYATMTLSAVEGAIAPLLDEADRERDEARDFVRRLRMMAGVKLHEWGSG